MMLTMLRKKELPIEYQKFAYISEDGRISIYHIKNWLGDDFFKTEYGSFLWDDSKAKIVEKITTKEKIIIKLVCIYDIDNITERLTD